MKKVEKDIIQLELERRRKVLKKRKFVIDLCNAISKKFINTDGQSGINACGDSSLGLSLKQEKECLVN